MMPELPWIKWFPQDWLSEDSIGLCDISSRGVWIECLNHMLRKEQPFIKGTSEQLAQLCRCRRIQMEAAIAEFKQHGVCDVIEQNGNITLTSRRLRKQTEIRELRSKAGLASATKRQQTWQHPSASASVSVVASKGTGEGKNDICTQVMEVWNQAAKSGRLRGCSALSEKRKTHIRERLKEPFFVEHWREAVERVRRSDFCCGKNDRGWQADFDFFIRPDSVPKIIEGKYDNHQAPKPPTPQDKRDERLYRDIQSI